MKLSNKLPLSKQEEIAKRLIELRKGKEMTQNKVASLIGVTEKTYREWEVGKYKNNVFYYPAIEYNNLFALSDLYNVSIDYLLCRSNFHSPENDFIGTSTGLSDTAITTIKSIKQESENWISECSVNSEFNYPGYNDLSTLNFMMEYGGILSNILRGLQDLLHNEYKIPVHLEGSKFVVPNNDYEYMPELEVHDAKFPEQYYLILARSKQHPDDNISIILDKSFFHSIALKKIERSFLELLQIYQEQQKN